MGKDRIQDLSKTLSWLLRHAATQEGLSMDTAGWVPLEQVLRRLRIDRATLDRVVAENNKSRLEVTGERIRACQGHSQGVLPVTREGLEATWLRYEGDEPVFHGTAVEAVASIMATGISSVGRTHVHLAKSEVSKVGKRAGVDVLLEVSPRRLRALGLSLFESSNGVVLVREVPPAAIAGLVCVSRKAQGREGELRALVAPERA